MYEKRFMKISELVKIGLPEKILYEICHMPGQTIARQYTKHGHWYIDTTKLDKELARRAE